MDVTKIEDKIDRVVAGGTEVSMELGGVRIKDMSELFELAKMLSISGLAVPSHLRGNPGAALAVCIKALRFGFDPFSLAEHSYTMKKSQKVGNQWEDVETIAYDSFVLRAIINAHANLTGTIQYTYEGEGDDRRCTASCKPPGGEVISVTSPTLGESKAARGTNDKGAIKGSPLWMTKSDQQQAYDTGRDLCRRYFPEILLGWYDRDEMDENVPPAKAVTPPGEPSPLRKRLQSRQRAGDRGFNHDGVHKTIDGEVSASEATPSTESPAEQSAEPAATAEAPAPQQEAVAATSDQPAEVSEPEPASQPAPEASDLPADAPAMPVAPKAAADYPAYVRATVGTMVDDKAIMAWWKTTAQKNLRNGLYATQEIVDEAMAIVRERVATLTEAPQAE